MAQTKERCASYLRIAMQSCSPDHVYALTCVLKIREVRASSAATGKIMYKFRQDLLQRRRLTTSKMLMYVSYFCWLEQLTGPILRRLQSFFFNC